MHGFVFEIDLVFNHGYCSEKTQRGTLRQPDTSAPSSTRHAAQCRSYRLPERAE